MRQLTFDDVRIDRFQIITAPAWAYEHRLPKYEFWVDLLRELERMRASVRNKWGDEVESLQDAADSPTFSLEDRRIYAELAKFFREYPWEGEGAYDNDLAGWQPPDKGTSKCRVCGTEFFSATRLMLCTDRCLKIWSDPKWRKRKSQRNA